MDPPGTCPSSCGHLTWACPAALTGATSGLAKGQPGAGKVRGARGCSLARTVNRLSQGANSAQSPLLCWRELLATSTRTGGRSFPGRKEAAAGECEPWCMSFPGQQLGCVESRRLHDAVNPGKVGSNVCVEANPVLVLIGEDTIGFVVADKWSPSITL